MLIPMDRTDVDQYISFYSLILFSSIAPLYMYPYGHETYGRHQLKFTKISL